MKFFDWLALLFIACRWTGAIHYDWAWLWKAHCGYASSRRHGVNANCARERIWFSPHCLA